MKNIHIPTLLLLTISLFSGCAVCHSYGPYKGQLIEAQTEEPIEGAAVVFEFSTEGFYAWSRNAYAVEKMTDKNGEFKIKRRFVVVFPRLFHEWVEDGTVFIFKPGYSAYDTGSVRFELNKPEKKNYGKVIRLTKLNSVEKRIINNRKLYIDDDVPKRKYKKFLKLQQMEHDILFNKSKR